MKFFKKAVCAITSAITAAAVCVGVSAESGISESSILTQAQSESSILPQSQADGSISAQAQNDLFRLYIVSEPETPEAGEDITITVMANTARGTSISALKFRLEFRTNDYTYKSENTGFNPLIDDSRANRDGYILYNYEGGAKEISGNAQEIISFTFNAVNPTGTFSFGASDRLVLAGDSGKTDITNQGYWENKVWEECKHEEYYIQTTKQPTCTATGVASYICRKCRVSFNSAEIPATGHDWDRTKATYTSAPTCLSTGSMSLPCKNNNCNATMSETVPAMGHNWGSWAVTKTATAYEEGEEARNCSRCNARETRAIARNPNVTTTASSSTTTTNQVSYLPTQLTDTGNGVVLQFRAGTVDNWTTLVVKKTEQTQTSAKYDISLLRNGITVQPNDTLYITIYIPFGLNGSTYYVYRVEEGGGYTDMGAVSSMNAVNFKTGHLSEYILSTVPLIVTEPVSTTPGTSANPPSTPATTPTPTTPPTTTVTSPSAVQFEDTTNAPQTPSSSNNTTAPPDVVWDGTTTPPVTTKNRVIRGRRGILLRVMMIRIRMFLRVFWLFLFR